MSKKQFIALIIEDSEEDIYTIKRYLKKDNENKYEIIATNTGLEGITSLKKSIPDFILLDYQLPDMSGIDFLSTVKKNFKDKIIPIIMFTGQGNEDIAVQALKNGANEYLVKEDLSDIKLYNAIHSAINTVNLQKTLEKQRIDLENTRNYLRNIINSIHSILIAIDDKGVITQWNSTAEEYTGIPLEQALTKVIWDIIPFLKKYQNDFQRILKTKKTVNLHREKDIFGSGKFYNVSISLLTYGAVIKIDDVTELKKKDDQLIQAQKMELIGNLAGGLAHDFNNILGGIIATVSFLKHAIMSNKYDLEMISNNISLIGDSAERAGEMVEQLVTLSRKHELSFQEVNLIDVIANVVNICKKLLDKSVKIKTDIMVEPSYIHADYSQIEQVLLNLCINATHAMTIMRKKNEKKGGLLTISLNQIDISTDMYASLKPGKYYLLKVIDTGVGMTKDTISKIFDPFFTTKEKTKGTGLGLSMVFNIVKLHNGYINVYSEPKIGSTFNLFLPVVTKIEERSIEKDKFNLEEYRGSGKILIIDDDKNIRMINKSILESCGYEAVLAEDGIKGISIFKNQHKEIKCIILDMVMPEMTGDKVYEKLKEISSDSIVILTSGFEQDKKVQKLINNGINGFLKKPYSMKDLLEKIKEITEL